MFLDEVPFIIIILFLRVSSQNGPAFGPWAREISIESTWAPVWRDQRNRSRHDAYLPQISVGFLTYSDFPKWRSVRGLRIERLALRSQFIFRLFIDPFSRVFIIYNPTKHPWDAVRSLEKKKRGKFPLVLDFSKLDTKSIGHPLYWDQWSRVVCKTNLTFTIWKAWSW